MATQALVSYTTRTPVPDQSIGTTELEQDRKRVELGGILIDQIDLGGAVERISGFLASGDPHQVVTVNLDFLSIARHDAKFRRALNSSDLAVADGMPLVWASRLRGQPLPERVAGVDLMHECCRLAAESGKGVFLLGAAPGVADVAGRNLQQHYDGLRIAGTYSPAVGPLSRKENLRILRMIDKAAPGFLFVALGAPRQDLWIRENRAHLHVPVSMGVGCVFDVLAGQVVRAPVWMQRAGLEWAYRLRQEPSRLWRRYLVNDTRMLARLVFESSSAAHTRKALTATA